MMFSAISACGFFDNFLFYLFGKLEGKNNENGSFVGEVFVL